VKHEATIAGLASESLARISGSAGAGSSAVVRPTPTDPVEFQRCARDLTLSAAKKHTNEERGGSRDPGVRRPGAGSGQVPARWLILRAVWTERIQIGLHSTNNLPPLGYGRDVLATVRHQGSRPAGGDLIRNSRKCVLGDSNGVVLELMFAVSLMLAVACECCMSLSQAYL